MKYVIESTENGCIETLEFADGSKFTKRSERTSYGCKSLDKDFTSQLEDYGFCAEIVEKVTDMFDGFGSLDFLGLTELAK